MSTLSSGLETEPSKKAGGRSFVCCLLHAGFSLGLLFGPEKGDDMFLRSARWIPTDYTALCSRRYYYSNCFNFLIRIQVNSI
jgi:hypothetical protein